MREAALRWLGAIGAITVVAPILFYGVTGGIIGFFLPCGADGMITAVTYRGADAGLGCGVARTWVQLSVALWGTTLMAAGGFLLAVADLLGT
ncbi:MAG: hypothetical protein R3324_02515 [Halobacteriales archaeon]|nr:hypothetical protein [Halobacteriales archaeon]